MPPLPTGWAIIQRYSHRVRELSILPFSQFTPLFLQATSLHPSQLLPNLKALEWSPECDHPCLPIIFIRQLLGPSLVSLSVNLDDLDDVTSRSFLANYPSFCPNLKTILIQNGEHVRSSQKTTELVSQSLIRFEDLQSFHIHIPINDVALMHVVMSSKLKKLSLILHPDISNLHRVLIPSDTIPFRNAEHVSLEVWDIHFVTTLLRTREQMFHAFILCHNSRPTIEVASALVTALVSPPRSRSLRSIRFMPGHLDEKRVTSVELDEFTMRNQLSYDSLRPLSSLRQLRQLDLDLGLCFSLDDDELVSLTRNWPLLEDLRLTCE